MNRLIIIRTSNNQSVSQSINQSVSQLINQSIPCLVSCVSKVLQANGFVGIPITNQPVKREDNMRIEELITTLCVTLSKNMREDALQQAENVKWCNVMRDTKQEYERRRVTAGWKCKEV